MRIATHGVAAVLALVVGLSLGYYLWGLRATDLTREVQQQRSECDYRVAEQERRAKAAEERARQEAETRKVFEEELQRVRPLK